MNTADFYIESLELLPHIEGGYFKEVYRNDDIIDNSALPDRYVGNRCLGTSIYFLLKNNDVSKLHRLQSDEIWHFYDGCPIHIVMISPRGKLIERTLGLDINNGQIPQLLIPKHHWFGAYLSDVDSFGFVGCTVIPGFEFQDFIMAKRERLLNEFPEYSEIINKLT